MRFNSAIIISSFLFISTALAGHHHEDNHRVFHNDEYAGAYFVESNGTFSTVMGTFTVPNASGDSGCGAFIWVGIDGTTCVDTMLMAGVDIYVNGSEIIYKAWCEFYPNGIHLFDLTVSPGDEITINVTAITATSGAVTVCNLSTGQKEDHKPNSTSPLCQSDALWLIYRARNPLVNFGTLTYTDATAYGPPARTYQPGPNGAVIADIIENNQNLTFSSINGSSITIHHV